MLVFVSDEVFIHVFRSMNNTEIYAFVFLRDGAKGAFYFKGLKKVYDEPIIRRTVTKE